MEEMSKKVFKWEGYEIEESDRIMVGLFDGTTWEGNFLIEELEALRDEIIFIDYIY